MNKILVIEDDLNVRLGIEEILKQFGFSVVVANDGTKGIELAKVLKPDLIICDIMMPEMDGYSVKEKLQANPDTVGIPFIFLSAKADLNDVRTGMNLGADDYITKPFKVVDLVSAIKSRLKRIDDLKSSGVKGEDYSEAKTQKNSERLVLNIDKTPVFVKFDDIRYISSSGNYTYIFMADQQKHIVRKSMKYWMDILPENNFKRIHRSTIINIDYIDKVIPGSSGTYSVYLKGLKKPLAVSQRYAKYFKKGCI